MPRTGRNRDGRFASTDYDCDEYWALVDPKEDAPKASIVERMHRYLRAGFVSANAHDMFMVAVNLAGFDGEELWAEMFARSRLRGKANERRVTDAMQRLCDRDEVYQRKVRGHA